MNDRRYHTLDGLRGIAAMIVVIGHSTRWFAPLPMPHSWLAVDLFFLLSGFVLARVYGPRFDAGLRTGPFLLQRFVRLWPLFALGVGIGAVAALARLLSHHGDLSAPKLVVAFVCNMLLLPSPTWADSPELFPLNGPGWSLFFELVANVGFVALWRWLNLPVLVAIIAAAGSWMLALYFAGSGFGGPHWDGFSEGFPRVFYSFFLGVLISRVHRADRPIVTNAAWLLPLLIVPPLFIRSRFDAQVDLALALVGYPALIWFAATVEPPRPRAFATLGVISYPLYAVHEPVVFFVWSALLAVHIDGARLAPMSGAILLLALLPLAWVLDRYYDGPVRKVLLGRLSPRPRRAEAAAEAATPL